MMATIKLLRVHQWYKNLLIFLPTIVGIGQGSIRELLLGFIGLCSISSITYIINDWIDRDVDKLHPTKKDRPLASGKISGKQAMLVASMLVIVVVGTSILLGAWYAMLIVIYTISTNLYSFWLKHIPILDIFLIASNFIYRTLAGTSSQYVVSDWPVFALLFVFIIIMLTHKRRSDHKLAGAKAIQHKPVLAFYTPARSYAIRGIGYVTALVLSYILFTAWASGWLLLGGGALFIFTSILFSRDPVLVIRPHYLLKLWYWDLFLIIIVGLIIKFG